MALLTRADTANFSAARRQQLKSRARGNKRGESRISESWLNYFACFIAKMIKCTVYTTPILFKQYHVNSSDKYVNSDCLPIFELRVVHINYANELASQFRFTK